MAIKKILMVHKISLLERNRENPDLGILSQKVKQKLVDSDLENRQSINDVFYNLVSSRIDIDLYARENMPALDESYDLVVVIGGDGTLFSVSHAVKDTPVMLVNSDPKNSVGMFSCCDRKSFPAVFQKVLKGEYNTIDLTRFSVKIGDRQLKEPVLNDILFAHKDPATMTRYSLQADGKREYQESSGVWISTAAGSTAAVFSAGGKVQPLDSREGQWVTREPFMHRTGKLKRTHGFFKKELSLLSYSVSCCVWLDGSKISYAVPPNKPVTISPIAVPLKLIGLNSKRVQIHLPKK